MHIYTVTVTPKYPTWNNQPFSVQVLAKSRADANKRARRDLENEGHVFTHSEAATFRAEPQ
jgi:hypothetical protein